MFIVILFLLLCTPAALAQDKPIVDLSLGNVYVYECESRQVRAHEPHFEVSGVIRYWTQILSIDSALQRNDHAVYRVVSEDHEGVKYPAQYWSANDSSFFQHGEYTYCDDDQVRMLYLGSELQYSGFAMWCFPPSAEYIGDVYHPLRTSIESSVQQCLVGDCTTQTWNYSAYFPCFGQCEDFTYISSPDLGLIGYEELEWTVPGINVNRWRLRGAVVAGVVYGDTSRTITDVSEFNPDSIEDVALSPNPTTGDVRIDFTLETQGLVTAELFDMRGALVQQVFQREYAAGSHRTTNKMDFVKAGVYVLRLQVGAHMFNRLLTVMK